MPTTVLFLGQEISIYYLSWLLAVVIALGFAVYIAKFFDYSPYRAFSIAAVALTMGFILICITAIIYGEFNLVRSVPFLPLIYLLVAKMFREPYSELTDFLAPIGVTCFGFTHFGCMFPGCCQGYPSDWGIYSNTAKTICFPIQPIEAVVSLAIGGLIFIMVKRKVQQGRLLFWMMTLWGSTRFFLEFFRDNEKIWHNVSELAFYALATFVVGVSMLIILTYRNKEYGYEEN